jgi:hypothetical protein
VFDQILITDFETRWARGATSWAPDGYTLSKMTTEEYIRSPLFHAFGMGYKWYGEDNPIDSPVYLTHAFLPGMFKSIDWSRTAVVAHNAQFDIAILTWIYGVKPAFIFDTLSMARALYGMDVGNSAKKLAERFNLPPKGHATQSSDGQWLLDSATEQELADYCKHDIFLCEKFLDNMLPGFPGKELKLIDATIRMFTEPQLMLDKEMLTKAIVEEEETRGKLLARLGVVDAQLSSNDQMATALAAVGVEPPKKISNTTGKEIYAFAKNDALFQQILNGDNEEAVLLCEARMKVKSTQERTRAQRFLDISGRGEGLLPVPVNYAHTRTLRWGASKGSAQNMQNLKRGGTLRKSIVAPPGHQCVAGDLRQIEPRVQAYLADFTELLDIFRSGKDAYATFGSTMFGIPGLSQEEHPDLRQSAKSALLGAGYRLGWASFSAQLLVGFLGAPPVRYDRAFMKQLGIGSREVVKFMEGDYGRENLERMMEIPRTCTDQELLVHCVCAKEIIDRYRRASKPIVDFWSFLDKMIATVIAVPDAASVVHKCLTFMPGKIQLPNGLFMTYDDIKVTADEKRRPQYTYWNGKTNKALHSGILAENVTSGTARCVIGDGMLRIQPKYKCAMPVHDEAVYVVPDSEVEVAVQWIKQQLIAPVKYLPGIPLDATVGANKRYGLAK